MYDKNSEHVYTSGFRESLHYFLLGFYDIKKLNIHLKNVKKK
jgi:hypothetical protein